MKLPGKKTFFIFIFILLQTMGAMLAGFFVLSYSTRDKIPQGVITGEVEIGGLNKQTALSKLKQYFSPILQDGTVTIIYNNKKYELPYSDIDFNINYSKTIDKACGSKSFWESIYLFKGNFNSDKVSIEPVYTLDDNKLTSRVAELAKAIDVKPVNATLKLEDKKVIKTEHKNGLELNVSLVKDLIKKSIVLQPHSTLRLDTSKDGGISRKSPEMTLYNLDGIDTVLGSYHTHIENAGLKPHMELAVKAINNCIIEPYAGKASDKIFSFNKMLKREGLSIDKRNESLNQVASTLYAALLSSGYNEEIKVERLEYPASYIKAGLDALVAGDKDLVFKNSFKNRVALVAEIKDNVLTITIAGAKADAYKTGNLRTELEAEFDPPGIYKEVFDLGANEIRVVDEGKKGKLVGVYRVMPDGKTVLLQKIKYNAQKAIYEIGPNTSIKGTISK